MPPSVTSSLHSPAGLMGWKDSLKPSLVQSAMTCQASFQTKPRCHGGNAGREGSCPGRQPRSTAEGIPYVCQRSALALGPCLLGFTGLAVPAIENSRILSPRWLQPCSSEPLPSLCLPRTTEGSHTGIAGPPDLCSTTRGWYPGARVIDVVI